MKEIAITKNSLPRVVIIGAGFAGMNLAKSLEGKPVQLILLDQNNHHQFQPLLYQVAIGGLEPDSAVAINWGIKYFSYDKANQLIIRKYNPQKQISLD